MVGEAVRRAWEAACRFGTITTGDPRARRFHSFGENSSVCFPTASLHGLDHIAIGSFTMIGPYSTLSAGEPFDPPVPCPPGQDPMLSIGDGCLLGRSTTVNAHHRIVIGDAVWMGDGVYITDQNHDWSDPRRPIGAQAQEPRAVHIGAESWIGNGAMILPGSTIGQRCVVAAGAVVTGPVPDHSIVGGVPARVLGSTAPSDSVVALPDERGA
jgi:acetyltransferase-like isoleucine patch superfamily enzyme